jgi:hypothetical protein
MRRSLAPSSNETVPSKVSAADWSRRPACHHDRHRRCEPKCTRASNDHHQLTMRPNTYSRGQARRLPKNDPQALPFVGVAENRVPTRIMPKRRRDNMEHAVHNRVRSGLFLGVVLHRAILRLVPLKVTRLADPSAQVRGCDAAKSNFKFTVCVAGEAVTVKPKRRTRPRRRSLSTSASPMSSLVPRLRQ